MPKVTLDMNTFKALASDTRLDILRALDGKKMSLKDICKATKLNKATLHEHLIKLNEAGLVKKKEREGHKWVYYKLTWKGEGLLHPENTRIVVMFAATFVAFAAGIIQFINFAKGRIIARIINTPGSDSSSVYLFDEAASRGGEKLLLGSDSVTQAPVAVPSIPVSLANQTTDVLKNTILENSLHTASYGYNWDFSDISIYAEKGSTIGYVNDTYQFNIGDNASRVADFLRIKSLDINNGVSPSDDGGLLTEGATETAANVPSSMVAIIHDPNLQIIAITCIIIAGVILSFAVWRYWKNKKPKL